MAVLCEALSVIVKTRSLNEKLKGGKQEFLKLIPNSTYCSDGELERVGFLSPEEAENYILTLKGKGLEFLQNNESVDIVVIDMLKGPTVSCEWIEFQRITFEEGKISAAWLFEGKRLLGKGAGIHMKEGPMNVHMPSGWSFTNSLSDKYNFVPNDEVH